MNKVDGNKIKALYGKARQLQTSGKHEEALELYGHIIQANPNIAEVHFQVGKLFLDYDRLDEAIIHTRAVTKLKPSEPDGWKIRADAVRSLSDIEVTEEFRKDLAEAPIDTTLRSELATAVDFGKKPKIRLNGLSPGRFRTVLDAMKRGMYDTAEQNALLLLREFPNVAALYDVLGVVQLSMGKLDEAERNLLKSIKLDPQNAESRNNYAQLLANRNRFQEGLHQATIALRIRPGMSSALINRSECFKGVGESIRAGADLARAVAHDPKSAETRRRYAEALADAKDHINAAVHYEAALQYGDANPLLYAQLGSTYYELNRPDDAMRMYRNALKIEDDFTLALARMGELHQTAGDFESSRALFARVIELEPKKGDFRRIAYASRKLALDDPVVEEMKTHFADESIGAVSRANFGFALSKVMEDNKAYDQVFTFLRPANNLMKDESPYFPEKRERHVDRMIEAYERTDWASVTLESKSEFAPIFVTGTPRSGTTLTEQIIASHSTVTGGGEVGYVAREALAGLVKGSSTRYRSPDQIPLSEYEALASGFEKYMNTLYPGIDRVTDKSIQVFDYIGLIKMAMPKARFIIVRRDPRDNLLSIYKNFFTPGTHQYSYDFKWAVHYYKMFVRMVDYWRSRVPDWFYEIQYEDLVSNPEEETRKLVAACGLEWEDACLDFHKTKRTVKTLSVYQVRQPMYKSSTKAWERYGDELNELFEALGPEYMDAAE